MTKNLTLAQEFFKHLGHFTNEDCKVFVQYLLRKIPSWSYSYPKVIVHKTLKLHIAHYSTAKDSWLVVFVLEGDCAEDIDVHISHYSAAEWIECRKKKMIILQEFDALDNTLEFIRANGIVNNKKWKEWKKTHVVLVAMWSVLLYVIPRVYFAKCLTNKGKLKYACEF